MGVFFINRGQKEKRERERENGGQEVMTHCFSEEFVCF
jgi:hypothetical protein